MAQHYEVRFASNPVDFKHFDTNRVRKEFLVEQVMVEGEINLVYTNYDRFIVGGAVPTNDSLQLDTIEPLKADFFLQRRELGIINVGAEGVVSIDGKEYPLQNKEALYVGMGNKDVVFSSKDAKEPAHFYFNSAPAHTAYPIKLITLQDAEVANMGSMENSNERQINKLIVNSIVQTCQLQMGMTELKKGSVWNTMPPHVHDRRMEAYFYFQVPEEGVVCHFMGQPDETRHIWVKNEQAVVSPNWSIHSGAGVGSYFFIWGMAGENLNYADMNFAQADELR